MQCRIHNKSAEHAFHLFRLFPLLKSGNRGIIRCCAISVRSPAPPAGGSFEEEFIYMAKQYDAGQLTVLEGLEAVRMRPGMYIGTTSSRGLHHLL